MQVDLQRTFSIPKDQDEDNFDWGYYLDQGSGKLTWKILHEKHVVVVVGEAGIGKTIEFKNEVQRLQEEGKAAFFIELNQLVNLDDWGLALGPSATAYAQWQASSKDGYFFLDAVDEARLTSHAAFKKALTVALMSLNQHLGRVQIAISSRLTDWSIDEVRATVDELFVIPIEAACRTANVGPESEFNNKEPTVQVKQPTSNIRPEAFVVSLDPLSRSEASKLAEAFSVVDAPTFWAAIDDGHYDYMATRPLDLRWMVSLWNQKGSLGTYLELIEGNVANRLTETNPSYQTSGAVLSLDQLRRGAEELAASSVFSGRAFITTAPTSTPRLDEVAPQAVLTDWTPVEVTRLLASAVFDEATFCRVKFHHRSVREYLAACWINRQIATGLPFDRVLPLFVASPFDIRVLISPHRWTLCWLTAINVKAREWVTRYFPEMFLFDGDPEAWDVLSADQAFSGYVQRLKDGLRTDWYNHASEFRRIGRRLPTGRVATLLADKALPTLVRTDLLRIIMHARLTDCADAVFGIYRNATASPRERRDSIEVLQTIATSEQREAIKGDLLSGALASNELIAPAIAAVDWKNLTADELAKLFLTTSSEGSYGPMAQTIKEDILPAATVETAAQILEAIVAALPHAANGTRIAKYPESEQPERAWLWEVLPDCIERLLTLLPTTLDEYPVVCLAAAELIEINRDTGFTNPQEFNRIHGLLAKHPRLRWQLGFSIAQSKDIAHSTSRLTWGSDCIVSFGSDDLPDLIARANNASSTSDERAAWFAVAKKIAFNNLRGLARKVALTSLEAGPAGKARCNDIAQLRAERLKGIQQTRSWKAEERQRKRAQLATNEVNKLKIRADIQHIREAAYQGTLHWLINYSYNHSSIKSLTCVDYEVIAKAFGQDIADALADGLKVVWARAGTPNPADYPDGSLPWDALSALAGLHTLLAESLDIAVLTEADAARAARLSVWELNGPPSWFERLAATHGTAVCDALHPWICDAALAETDAHHLRSVLEMALRCSTDVRSKLIRPLAAMISDGRIARSETIRAVVDALREDGLIASNTIAELCRSMLLKSIGTDGLIGESRWLCMWLEEDARSAWAWFEAHVAGLGTTAGAQVKDFAKTMVDCNWVKKQLSNATIGVLLQMDTLLKKYLPPSDTPIADEDSGMFGHPIARFREAIPGVLVQIRGAISHRALTTLAVAESDQRVKSWLGVRVYEHATFEADLSAHIDPSNLRAISAPFLTEPRSEAQLFQQVVARLEEIRKGIEEGPFSERDLFSLSMPEKHIQQWLAARFRDTPNRRFSVHREEEVDDDKKTDIQLSCPLGNVCIEIKPVNKERGYSARSLVKTLQTQIVDQYLKGYNSTHGILVLCSLDKKTWDIPGGKKRQPISALVTYLQEQANTIKAERGIQELIVFAIDCTAPTTP
jgi:hypothetical protein